jgi:hypothetical protein
MKNVGSSSSFLLFPFLFACLHGELYPCFERNFSRAVLYRLDVRLVYKIINYIYYLTVIFTSLLFNDPFKIKKPSEHKVNLLYEFYGVEQICRGLFKVSQCFPG